MVVAVSQDAANRIIAHLSKRLAQERESRGISKKRLAAMAGIDRSTIGFIENPSKNPTLYSLARYAIALGLDLGTLISEGQRASDNERNVRPGRQKRHQ